MLLNHFWSAFMLITMKDMRKIDFTKRGTEYERGNEGSVNRITITNIGKIAREQWTNEMQWMDSPLHHRIRVQRFLDERRHYSTLQAQAHRDTEKKQRTHHKTRNTQRSVKQWDKQLPAGTLFVGSLFHTLFLFSPFCALSFSLSSSFALTLWAIDFLPIVNYLP